MLSYPAGLSVSNHALITLADALRQRRTTVGTRWRRISAGEQAMLVVAYLRKGDTYAELGAGYGIGTTTVFRYVQEAIEVLAAFAPTLTAAVAVIARCVAAESGLTRTPGWPSVPCVLICRLGPRTGRSSDNRSPPSTRRAQDRLLTTLPGLRMYGRAGFSLLRQRILLS
jgi:hypothetical protein